jgi:stage III sporulation protein AE
MRLYHVFLSAAITAPQVPGSGADRMPQRAESFGEGLYQILRRSLELLRPDLAEAAQVSLSILALVMLLSLVHQFPQNKSKTCDLVGALCIGAILLQRTNSLIQLGLETVTELSAYGKLLIPVMTSALAAQGGVTKSTALFAGTTLFSTVLCSLISGWMPSLICFYLALSTGSCALEEDVLKKMAGFVSWAASWVLKIILYVFTGYIGITGVVSGTTDASLLKAAKLTISGMVPVVGGILSDASEAVLVSAGVMKSAAGIYGILAIVAVFAGPFLRIGVHYLLLKLTGLLCGLFGSKACTRLVSDFSSAMGLILAMTGSECLLLLISTVCFLKGVG